MHWANTYIGKPYLTGGRGPVAYDCWGLFRSVQAAHYGRELPEIGVDADDLRATLGAVRDHPERARWVAIPEPHDGCAVLLRQARYPSHIGTWLEVDLGRVLHAVRGAGVIASSTAALLAAGWRIDGFYRRVAT